MHNTQLIMTLTAGLTAGLVLGYITHQLKLSPIVGYLLAGIVLGPFTPGFIADQHLAEQLAEIGAMLLMFGVGLHFHLEDLLAVRRIAIPGAIAQIIIGTLLGALIASSFGWGWQAGFVYGLSLSVASTVVLTRVLVDNHALHTATGHVAVGWLIVEDMFTVLVLVVLPIFFASQTSQNEIFLALILAALKVLALVAGTFLLGVRAMPWLFTRVAASGSQELFTLTVLVSALGIAVASMQLFNVSMALGAFLAGMVVGKSEFSLRAASEALPLRDAFAVLFFVSVGMLLDPKILLDNPAILFATLAVVIIGKGLVAFAIVLLLGYPIQAALGVSVALAQIGEFSFILSSLGKQLGLLSDLATNTLVATAIISITLNPILYRCIPYMNNWIYSKPALLKFLTFRLRMQLPEQSIKEDSIESQMTTHAVIVGYGPIGEIVTKLLRENALKSVVIELNLATVHKLRSEGVEVVYGDAGRSETLKKAGISGASTLILSASSIANAEELIRQAKELNPAIRVIARTAYVREIPRLKKAGCEIVFAGEGEVALALTEEVLRNLGATPEKIEIERQRVRRELIEN